MNVEQRKDYMNTKKLTKSEKSEIKRTIENDIKELGVYDAFKKLILGNIKVIVPQFDKAPKSLQKVVALSNLAVSISINSYRDVGLISELYDVVLYEKNENVVHDEIMNYAIEETMKLV